MSEKINSYLNRLKYREKIIFLILMLVLGVFFGINIRTGDEGVKDESLADLENKLQRQIDEINKLKELSSNFSLNSKKSLEEIYKNAKDSKIIFANIKTSSSSEAQSTKHTILLEFKSSFEQSMAFIESLQRSQSLFLIPNITMLKDGLFIKTTMSVEFISLM